MSESTKKKQASQETKQAQKPAAADRFWDFVKQMAIALVLALCIKTSIVEAYKIPSGSMEDTLLIGDFLLANKFLYGSRLPIPFVDVRLPEIRDPEPGDIVIFKYPLDPSINYIKRCVAIGGQTVEIRDKQVYVDGVLQPLPNFGKYEDGMSGEPGQLGSPGRGRRDNMPPTLVPEGHFFMMGDNRDRSSDSRFWGFVPRQNILGKAMIIHWSWEEDPDAPVTSWREPFSYVKSVAYNSVHFFQRVRWSRIFDPIS